jgi:Pentapeptide repeats (8 copies)
VQQREREQRIASESAQDEALQAYLDGMSQLLTDREQPLHRAQPGDRLSTLARARTLTVLGRLDGSRKRSDLQFLYESGLIDKERILLNEVYLIERRHNIVSLNQANLSGANLVYADLSGANLIDADLRKANLNAAQGWTEKQLSEARTLKGATMPDGRTLQDDEVPDRPTFEEWLKSRREENSGTS